MQKSKLYHIYPTMNCNLNCQHCFLHQEVRNRHERMSNEQFKTVTDLMVQDFIEDPTAEFAEVTIIGGEPSLMPPKFYLENIPYLREQFAKTHKPISLTIVSNFTSTNSLARYAHLFDVVSTSYEWDRFDSQHILTKTSSRKKDVWWRNVDEWIASGKKLSISIATTSETIKNWKEMFDLLYAKGVRQFQVNLMHPDGELMKAILSKSDYETFSQNRVDILTKRDAKFNFTFKPVNNDLWPSFEAEAEFLIDLTGWLFEKNDPSLAVYPIENHIQAIAEGSNRSDIACPASDALCITTDGYVSGCTIESGKTEMINYGNAYSDDLETITNSPVRQRHTAALAAKPIECYGCEFYEICRGGCSFRELFWDKDETHSECHGLKKYLNYLKENYPKA